MNEVRLTGFVARVGKMSDNGKLNFVVAALRETGNFITVTAFKKKAEFVTQYVSVGMRIGVEGHLKAGSFKKDGKKIFTQEFVMDDIEFLDKKKDPAIDPAEKAVQEVVDDDLPF